MKSGGSKRIILIAIVLCAAAGLGRIFFGRLDNAADSSPGPAGTKPVPVEVARIERGPILLTRTFSGELEAGKSFVVAPKVSGRVSRVMANIADTVFRGQVVAVLDDEEFVQAVAQARADLLVARANLAGAQSALATSEKEFKRTESLFRRGIASDSDLDAARQDHLAQKAQVDVWLAQVEKAGSSLETANIRLGYTQVRANWVDDATKRSDDKRRVVAERFVDSGQTVAANAPLLRIVEMDPIVGVIFVNEKDYGRLAPEQPVSLTTDAYPGEVFAGRIERIAPVFSKTTRQARVEMRIENPAYRLKPGMFIRAAVELDSVDDADIVPGAALTVRDDKTGVFLVSPDGASVSWQPVTVGIRQGKKVQVAGQGLSDRTLSGRVVILGQQLLDNGSAIIIPARSGEAGGKQKAGTP